MQHTLPKLTTALALTLLALSANAVDNDGGSATVIVEATNLTDTDFDGLTDAVEALLGTNPNKTDSDNDGIDDGFETIFGMNPTNNLDSTHDFDNDSLDNKAEYAAGSDPFLADTDNDGWFDNFEVAYDSDPADASDKPVPSRPEDVDADGRMSAIDLQHTINAALGATTGVPTNVNQVGNTDAIDIQLVVNAALGL